MQEKIKKLSDKLISMFNEDLEQELTEVKASNIMPGDRQFCAKNNTVWIWTSAETLLAEHIKTISDD